MVAQFLVNVSVQSYGRFQIYPQNFYYGDFFYLNEEYSFEAGAGDELESVAKNQVPCRNKTRWNWKWSRRLCIHHGKLWMYMQLFSTLMTGKQVNGDEVGASCYHSLNRAHLHKGVPSGAPRIGWLFYCARYSIQLSSMLRLPCEYLGQFLDCTLVARKIVLHTKELFGLSISKPF